MRQDARPKAVERPDSGRSTPTRAAGADAGDRRRTVSPWVKALVLFHVVGIVAWALPRPRREITQGGAKPFGSDYLLVWGDDVRRLAPISVYVQASGSWQYWDMFAPEPANIDQWGDAEVEYRDGTKRVASYPRMYSLNLFERYMKERYRKFFERAGAQEYAYAWPTFAVQMARLAPGTPENPPVAVTLRRHTLKIAAPGAPQSEAYTEERYFRYVLRPGDLNPSGSPPGDSAPGNSKTGRGGAR